MPAWQGMLVLRHSHGDTLLTTDATATTVTGLLTYSPDGRPLSGTAGNVVESPDYGWLGSHSRPAEDGATIIQMGARLYLPAIGRFLSVDPVEAGTPNDYVYPADPVNQFDLTGKDIWPDCVFGRRKGRNQCKGSAATATVVEGAFGVTAGAVVGIAGARFCPPPLPGMITNSCQVVAGNAAIAIVPLVAAGVGGIGQAIWEFGDDAGHRVADCIRGVDAWVSGVLENLKQGLQCLLRSSVCIAMRGLVSGPT